jgi:hypothetical protein
VITTAAPIAAGGFKDLAAKIRRLGLPGKLTDDGTALSYGIIVRAAPLMPAVSTGRRGSLSGHDSPDYVA